MKKDKNLIADMPDPGLVANLSPEELKEHKARLKAHEIRRQYRAAGKLAEWEKKRDKSPALKD